MSALTDILTLADHYCAATGRAESTVSSLVFADGKRIRALRAGKDVGVRRAERALRWFSDNWPAGTPWPVPVPRPAPAETTEAGG